MPDSTTERPPTSGVWTLVILAVVFAYMAGVLIWLAETT